MQYKDYLIKCAKEGKKPAPESARLCYMTLDEYYAASKKEDLAKKEAFSPMRDSHKYQRKQLNYHLNLGSDAFGCGKKTCDIVNVAVRMAV